MIESGTEGSKGMFANVTYLVGWLAGAVIDATSAARTPQKEPPKLWSERQADKRVERLRMQMHQRAFQQGQEGVGEGGWW